MKMKLHAQKLPGVVHPFYISEPVIHADNEAKKRSGHMGHGMTEFAPGKVIALSANTSAVRGVGHEHYGWMDYAISEDYGNTFSEPKPLPYAMQTFLDGECTISVEKAVTTADGQIAAFCLRWRICGFEGIPLWGIPMVVLSADGGKTWGEAKQVSGYAGRIFDAVCYEGDVYALEFCNPTGSMGEKPEHKYRLFKSEDNCESFELISIVPFDTLGRTYGNMIFTPEGDLIVYAYDKNDERGMDYIISHDKGETWEEPGKCYMKNRIRNPQIGYLDGQYYCTARAGQIEYDGELRGEFVIYTSADGIHWDDGKILIKGRPCCFYSENLTLTMPDGSTKMLLKYSENYDVEVPGCETGRVNSMMLQITTCKD